MFCNFPLLVLKGVFHYWTHIDIFPGALRKWKGGHANDVHRVNTKPFQQINLPDLVEHFLVARSI